jgi:hypothetical protein
MQTLGAYALRDLQKSFINLINKGKIMEINKITFKLPDELYDALTEENVEEIADGIAASLKIYTGFVSVTRGYTNDYESKNTEIMPSQEMWWKDDGKKDFNLEITGVRK